MYLDSFLLLSSYALKRSSIWLVFMYVLLNEYECGWLSQIHVNNRDNKIYTVNHSEFIKYF